MTNGDLVISLFLPKSTPTAGIHYDAQQANYIAQGDLTAAASLPHADKIESWVFVTEVDVASSQRTYAVVAFGDSITDGAKSTLDTNHRWPNFLIDRLQAQDTGQPVAVVDEGIGGNRILHDASGNVAFGANALSRFGRDVLEVPGVRFLIVLEGINDIDHAGSSAPQSEAVSADDIIGGFKQLNSRAHEHGLKIYGATLTPFVGTVYSGYYTPEKEVERKAVNQWIRARHAFDGVIDFREGYTRPEASGPNASGI